jgi:molybdopterin-guanine dinucleotide biosynthesis protein A
VADPVDHPSLTGILLVGGASSRFGSPKPLARLGGRTLAEIGWERLAFCGERIAVGKAADGLDLPFPVLDDGSDVRAAVAGVAAGLRAARSDVCVVLPVDTPRVTAAVLQALAAACADAAVPSTGPLPGAYRKTALPALDEALRSGTLSLRRALAGLDTVLVDVDPSSLINVNTPDDLRRI